MEVSLVGTFLSSDGEKIISDRRVDIDECSFSSPGNALFCSDYEYLINKRSKLQLVSLSNFSQNIRLNPKSI